MSKLLEELNIFLFMSCCCLNIIYNSFHFLTFCHFFYTFFPCVIYIKKKKIELYTSFFLLALMKMYNISVKKRKGKYFNMKVGDVRAINVPIYIPFIHLSVYPFKMVHYFNFLPFQ